MPGLVRGEANGTTTPLLTFAYQAAGALADVVALRFRVRDVTAGAPVEVVAWTDVDLVASRLGVGRYVAPFTPTDGVGGWNFGTHEIEWQYQAAAGDPQRVVRRRFEVLDPAVFSSGLAYVGYADSVDLATVAGGVQAAQRAINETSRHVEAITARFFEPRYLVAALDGVGTPMQLLPHPVMAVEQVAVGYSGYIGPQGRTLIASDDIRVYNRHLAGVFDPDDRDNPRLEYIEPTWIVLPALFPKGKQNVEVTGLFGYTDPDGSPCGQTPLKLARAVLILASRLVADPMASDPFTTAGPGRIRSARTRDQAITFAGAGDGGLGAITGDRAVDDLLVQYMRPSQMAAV